MNTKTVSELKKGDTCFVANSDTRSNHHRKFKAVVSSSGAKWITANGQKFNRDGYGEFGYQLYVSQEDFEEKQECKRLRSEIEMAVSYRGNKNLDVETLRVVAKLLGLAATEE